MERFTSYISKIVLIPEGYSNDGQAQLLVGQPQCIHTPGLLEWSLLRENCCNSPTPHPETDSERMYDHTICEINISKTPIV